MADAEAWQGVLSPYGTRLYEEYGRHESLQSCVRKHKEAGHPSPEALGALEWLLLHHTPEVAEREGKDPLDVLLTTVFMGCCDVEEFVRAVVKCLKVDSSVLSRLHQASMAIVHQLSRMASVSCIMCYVSYVCNVSVHYNYYLCLEYDATVLAKWSSQPSRDPSSRKVQVNSNVLTCAACHNGCVPNHIAGKVRTIYRSRVRKWQ